MDRGKIIEAAKRCNYSSPCRGCPLMETDELCTQIFAEFIYITPDREKECQELDEEFPKLARWRKRLEERDERA